MSSISRRDRTRIMKFLGALETQIEELGKLAQTVEHGMSSEHFSTYIRFRSKVGEMLSFSAIIEKRIEDVMEFNASGLSDNFIMLNISAIVLLVRCNKTFFSSMITRRVMPFGVKDLLISEVRFLDSVRTRLSQPEYLNRLDRNIFQDLDNIMTLIRSIADRTMSLEDFTQPDEEAT